MQFGPIPENRARPSGAIRSSRPVGSPSARSFPPSVDLVAWSSQSRLVIQPGLPLTRKCFPLPFLSAIPSLLRCDVVFAFRIRHWCPEGICSLELHHRTAAPDAAFADNVVEARFGRQQHFLETRPGSF